MCWCVGDRLRRLDARAMPSLRQPGESAEHFLRRIAVARTFPWGGKAQPGEVQAALREHFAGLDNPHEGRAH